MRFVTTTNAMMARMMTTTNAMMQPTTTMAFRPAFPQVSADYGTAVYQKASQHSLQQIEHDACTPCCTRQCASASGNGGWWN
jgi:hypothetical protein